MPSTSGNVTITDEAKSVLLHICPELPQCWVTCVLRVSIWGILLPQFRMAVYFGLAYTNFNVSLSLAGSQHAVCKEVIFCEFSP